MFTSTALCTSISIAHCKVQNMNKSTPFLNYRGIACGAGHFYALNFPKHAQLEEGVFVRFSIAFLLISHFIFLIWLSLLFIIFWKTSLLTDGLVETFLEQPFRCLIDPLFPTGWVSATIILWRKFPLCWKRFRTLLVITTKIYCLCLSPIWSHWVRS